MGKVTDEQFIAAWNKFGSMSLVAAQLGISESAVVQRRRKCAGKGIKLDAWNDISSRRKVINHSEGRVDLTLEDGVVIVFSDAHYWTGIRTTAHRALVAMVRELKPRVVICGGDAFDGSTAGRWPHINWLDKQKKPTVADELEAVKERLGEIESAAPVGCEFIWPAGNHDNRFEQKLAAVAPEYEGCAGFTLKEHYPRWTPCWTAWINGETVVTHFYHCGVHDGHNNLLKGQVNYVTGHTHSLKVTPWTNAKGETLWAVNTGTLADALGSHNLDYQQGRHGNHRSGFAVLTYRNGKLLMPELVMKHDEDHIEFRGHILHADTLEIA